MDFAKRNTFIFLALILVGIFAVIYYSKIQIEQNMANAITVLSGEPSPTPTVAIVQQKTEVNSSDGTKTLLLMADTINDTTTYSIAITNTETNENQLLWKSSENADTKITAPKNSWSPDNKYFYLLDNQENAPHPLVFNASGEAFLNGEVYLDVFSLFGKRESAYTITNASGWASETLLYVQTAKVNEKGPTFWFEVPSRNFLQLAG